MSDDSPQASQWSDIQALLDEALALPPAARGAWLRALPPEYDTLREILRRLLESRAHVDGVTFAATTAHDPSGSRPIDPIVSPGDLVGPYRVLRELGSGGMGAVWLAERADGQLRRKFALKLPRLTWAPDLAARVARERDILVSLEHPNIARLYDAGVDALGRPFLALEYVEGQRIDAYCDEHRLGVRERVELLKQIVDAVQYAHTQLVIHRDLKPANVLVNSRGKAILLDFGIASLIADTSGSDADPVAMTLSRALTPRFASPEQLQGVRLSLTSDVYSLGVMMYDLLVGTTPYRTRNSTRGEFERAVVEGDIRVPSQAELTADIAARRGTTATRLSRQLGGDLDAIVTKSMQLRPQDRYTTVEAMGADIERWLTGHPVLAKPPSRIDRWVKFTRRNPVSVSLGTLAGCLITVSTVIAVTQSLQARSESRRANATNTFLLEMFGYANPELHGGRDITARELLIEGEKRVSSTLKEQPDVQAAVFEAIASAWVRFGDMSRVADIAKKRTEIYAQDGLRVRYVRSLIDEAQIAFSTADKKQFESLVQTVNKESAGLKLPLLVQADVEWMNGWRLLEDKKYIESYKLFYSSLQASKRESDPSRALRGLYGLLKVSHGVGNRRRLLEEFSSADRILQGEIKDDAEGIRRGLEISAFMYEAGELVLGYPQLSRLMETSKRIYGNYHPSQQSLYMYWLTWLYFVNKPADGLLWLSNNQESFLTKQSDPLNHFYSQIIKLRLARVQGDIESAKRVSKQIEELSLDNEESFQRIRALTEFALTTNDLGRASRLLSSRDWSVFGDQLTPINEYQRQLLFGVYYAQKNDTDKAAVGFKRAYEAGLQAFGDRDFRVGVAYLAKYLLTRSNKTEAEASKVNEYLGLLRAAHSHDHPRLVEIETGIRKKDSTGGIVTIRFSSLI